METIDVETLANAGAIAAADFELGRNLRHIVIPKFFLDVDNVVGRVHWRRQVWTQLLTLGIRNYDLPEDWERFEILKLQTATGLEEAEMTYIGESADYVLEAEAATVPGKPAYYYVVAGSDPVTTGKPFALRIGNPTDSAYTLLGVYQRQIPFENDTDSMLLDPYIPKQYQGALVLALRAKIYENRYGIGDNRYQSTDDEYDEWIDRMSIKKEPAPRGHAVFVR